MGRSGEEDRVEALGDVRSAGVASLRRVLPPQWSLLESSVPPEDAADHVLVLRGPHGQMLDLLIDVKRTVQTRDVPHLAQQRGGHGARPASTIDVVMARYLAGATRERLEEAGLSYVDATGNVLLQADTPGLFIRDRGADRDPWRGPGRPRGTLKGEPAAKVVRALTDFGGAWSIRELIEMSRASTGSVYRVLEFLDSQGLVTKSDEGLLAVPDWAALLRRWSEDYQFLSANTVSRWIAPRGLPDFLDRVREHAGGSYALTGSVAAAAWAAYAPPRLAMVYAVEPDRAVRAWGLRPTDTGANVLLATPVYDVLLARTSHVDVAPSFPALEGLTVVAPTQVAVDLLTAPGRAPAEAEELLRWMGHHEQSWR